MPPREAGLGWAGMPRLGSLLPGLKASPLLYFKEMKMDVIKVDELELLTIKEVCALLKISRTFLHELAGCDGFPTKHNLGRSIRWYRKDIQAWVDRRKVK